MIHEETLNRVLVRNVILPIDSEFYPFFFQVNNFHVTMQSTSREIHEQK